jgi:hypothetical protein
MLAYNPQPTLLLVEGEAPADRKVLDDFVIAEVAVAVYAGLVHSSYQ